VQQAGSRGYLFVVIGIGVSELMNALGQFVMSTQSLVHLTSLYLWNMGNFVGQGYGTSLPVSLLLCSSVPGPSVSPAPSACCAWDR
jgi:iron complex transport system permease protein